MGSALLAPMLRADVIDTTWLGGTGSWHDASKWSAGVVPNNSGTTTFNVFIPGGMVSGSTAITVNRVNLAGAATLTISSGLYAAAGESHLDGFFKVEGGFQLTGMGKLTGVGTIDVGSVSSYARLSGTEGLEIGNGLTVQSSKHGLIGLGTKPLINRGRIQAGHYDHWVCPYVSFSTIVNEGAIEARNGHLVIGSDQGQPFTRADLGQTVTGSTGTMLINGTLLNNGQVLNVDSSERWGLLRGGTILGGTIEIAAGERFEARDLPGGSPATLDGVTVNGRLRVGGRLDIKNGLLQGNAQVGLSPVYDAAAILYSSSGSLTIDPAVTIRAELDDFSFSPGGTVGDGSGIVINHGLIGTALNQISPANVTVRATSVANDGTFSLTRSSTLSVRGAAGVSADLVFGSGGTLDAFLNASSTGLLDVSGKLDLSGTGDVLRLTAGTQVETGTFFRIVKTGAGVLGTFDAITPGFEVMYSGNDILARLVPEPTLLSSIAAGALIARRPRCKPRFAA
jgi:hypothetical protein